MEPLASTLRPQTLDAVAGQEHLIGTGKPLRVAIEKRELFSFILWGPPGCGKTTLARIYAQAVDADFFELSGVTAGKDDMRKVVEAPRTLLNKKHRILFLDEIHRLNKAQQDYLLPFVERGDILLIGATTENPSFEVNAALLSRCRVFTLKELSEDALRDIVKRTDAVSDTESAEWIARYASGDARQALTIIETTQKLYGAVTIEHLKQVVASNTVRYDKAGEEHYNTISAFIKSMRAGQPDAAVYYLARMVEAGEDPVFIARRMVIFASEDIGLAQPTALVVANAVFAAVQSIGYPEAAINLAHGVCYLAECKKDRRAYDALRNAQADVKEYGNLPVPHKIRNAPTQLMKDEGYGKNYEMYDADSYLPEQLQQKKYLSEK
jgi:putative ATPase